MLYFIQATEGKDMPYREKTAWLALIAMAITFGPYFAIVKAGIFASDAPPNLRQLGVYAAAALAQVVILGIGHLYLRYRSPEEARTPPDERDLAIKYRSMSYAYGVLIAGMIMVGVFMPFNSAGWSIVNAALFMIVVSEVVHYGAVVAMYRRQA
jgi:hypothetical protein